MRLIVLGASGFIGREIVVRAAALHGPATVIAAVRRPRDAGFFPAGVEQRAFDAEDGDSVPRIGEDAGHVVNCVMGSERAMIESCRGAIRAVAGQPGRRLIHFSSIAVFGDARGAVAENAPPGRPADGYAAAKIEAERMLVEAQAVDWTILRPGLVHGRGSMLWTWRIARLVAARRLGPLGPRGTGPCNLVAVGDVASGALAACSDGQVGRRAFALVADDPPSWNEYLTDMAHALGISPRPLSPARLGIERALAFPFTALKRLGLPAPEALTPGLVRLFDQQVRFASSAVPLLLPAWQDYETVLADGARWVAERTAGHTRAGLTRD